MENYLGRYSAGAATGNTTHDVYNTHIIELSRFLTTPLQIIRKYIPEKDGKRSSSCYHLLIVVYGNPYSTSGRIRSLLHSSNKVIDEKLKYLVSLSYIKKEDKPRLTIPPDGFKLDKAYNITPKGIKVIRDILSAAKGM